MVALQIDGVHIVSVVFSEVFFVHGGRIFRSNFDQRRHFLTSLLLGAITLNFSNLISEFFIAVLDGRRGPLRLAKAEELDLD